MKTYSAKPTDVSRQWYILDASEAPLGRVATRAATLLTGKGKPMFTQHIDVGDFVVIINADKLIVTGNKATQKTYYRHSGYPGNLKAQSLTSAKMADSTKVLEHAIRGMLPVNKLRDARLARLKIYPGAEHRHEPQQPKLVSIKDIK